MTYDELRAFVVLLAVAANDTTRHASAQAIYAFSKFPDQKALLVKDIDGRIDTAVEEVLRWVTPLNNFFRRATQDAVETFLQVRAVDAEDVDALRTLDRFYGAMEDWVNQFDIIVLIHKSNRSFVMWLTY